ncbi:MAG: STAS-like domain-containing protein [Desulfosarcina sp.]|nr:STAS-like domain-containing protein [Desulfosarcina sp.]MBC2742863.1 STAS-like domain-containing protein [Desulfosarcina sp.]MBC2765773.1 STAS-like domain-containing protein [Desulfosarcina sp.]
MNDKMKPKTVIRVTDVVGDSRCIRVEDGQHLYKRIVPLIRQGKHVAVSFDGVEMMIPPFISSAFGRLHGEFTKSRIRSKLSLIDISSNYLNVFQRTMEWAEFYYENPDACNRIWEEEMGEEVEP